MSFVALMRLHGRPLLFVVAALALAGGYAAFSLPVGLFPRVTFPRVVINIEAGDRPAEQMALVVTKPVEEAIRVVPGVREVRSVSSRGAAEIAINFAWGLDMVAATLQVDAAIAQLLPQLPASTTYLVRRMDPTVFPIIAYGLSSPSVSPIALRDLAQFRLVPLLSTIPGVARVTVQGGAQQELQVLVDPQRLASFGLAVTDITQALASANLLSAVGRLEDHYKLFLVVSDASLHNLEQIRDVVVASSPSGVVHVGDVAQLVDGTVPSWTRVDTDGKPAVLFQIYEQPDGNAVQIAAAVRQQLDRFKPQLPPGVALSNWYDQSALVVASAQSVRDAILIGLVLAGLVLLLFLRSWRVTLIAMLVVPATLATTVLLLGVLGANFNIMTLGGLAAAIGLIIDDVIVMIEHIVRRADAADSAIGDAADPALAAGREFLVPLGGSSLATLIVFLPLAFLTGVSGAFFQALAITMAAALIISWLFTAIAVPLLAGRLLGGHRAARASAGPGRIERLHRTLLDGLFRAPWLILAALVPLLVLGWVAYGQVGTGFMPAMDEGGFIIDYRTPPGTAVTETDREVRQVEAILQSIPEVATFSRRTGLGLGGDLNEPNQGDFFVRLKPGPRRPIDDIMAETRRQVEVDVPGFQMELAQLMEDLIGDLTAVPQPIEVKLFSANVADLIPQARQVAAAIAKIAGVVDVKNGVVLAGDALTVRVDATMAALEGLDPDAVTRALNGYLTGTVATQLPQTLKLVGVRVWLPPALRQRDSDLGDLAIRAPDGHLVPLRRVAAIVPDPGQPEIMRDNLQQAVAVTARIEGRDLGSTAADVRQVLDRAGFLKPGMTYQLGGLYEQQQIAFGDLSKVFLAALAAEFVLLLFLYGAIRLALIILLSSLLSTTAVFMALWLTGIELNITAMMGMTMVIGIATEMAIFYVSEFRDLRRQLPLHSALIEASRNRLRPIAMTTLAAILTLLPLALGIGEGSAMQQPLALAIIAGLSLQFPLVLLVMPVIIGLTSRRSERDARA
jgi:CzcA family heavy metal efflux pump